MILSPGRTGSILLAKLLETCVGGPTYHHDNSNSFSRHPIIHTHFLNKWKYLNSTDTLIFSTRRNMPDFVASDYIAGRTEKYSYWNQFDQIDTSNLIKKEKIPLDLIESRLNVLKTYHILYKEEISKQRSKNTHLLWYEDWVHDYSILPFHFLLDLSKAELPIQTPINKSKYIDYNDLEQKILQFRHNTIIENIDDPIFTK